jgi:hypothetical protein
MLQKLHCLAGIFNLRLWTAQIAAQLIKNEPPVIYVLTLPLRVSAYLAGTRNPEPKSTMARLASR